VTRDDRVRRGDVWLAALDPTIGRKIQKTRPCVVISPAEMHDYPRTVIAAPMTTGSHVAPFRITVHFQGKSGLILLDQLRTLDKQRLVSAAWPRDRSHLDHHAGDAAGDVRGVNDSAPLLCIRLRGKPCRAAVAAASRRRGRARNRSAPPHPGPACATPPPPRRVRARTHC